jgi:hypothetical protein
MGDLFVGIALGVCGTVFVIGVLTAVLSWAASFRG